MKLCAILPALTILAGTIGAQTPSPKPGSIEGVVTNSVTREPVKKATVALRKSPGPVAALNQTTTDATGHFRFDQVAPGSYSITANHDGFGKLFTAASSSARVNVAEEQRVQDVALKLVPDATVSGHVLDEDGDPIVRAQVTVLRYSYGSGPKRLNQFYSAQSNDLGEFDALDLAPGRYYIAVSVPPLQTIPPHTRWTHPEEAYPRTFYPNASDAGQASAIDVAAGAHVDNIDFRLHKMLAYHIRGRVIDEAAADASVYRGVTLRPPESNSSTEIAATSLETDGSFDLRGVMAGSYTLLYVRFTAGKFFNVAQAVRVTDADIAGMVLAPKPRVSFSGMVTLEGSQPDHWDLQVDLDPAQGGDPPNSTVGAGGKLAFGDIAPDVYTVQINGAPSGKYVKSIRFGDQETTRGEIDLAENPSAQLNIVLGADGGEVNGMVQTASGQPAASALVTLAPAEEYNDRQDLSKRVGVDAAGNFQIKDVAPGEYTVFAWENDPDGSTQSAEFRKPFEGRGVAVSVEPSGKTPVQLILITADDMQKERSKLP